MNTFTYYSFILQFAVIRDLSVPYEGPAQGRE